MINVWSRRDEQLVGPLQCSTRQAAVDLPAVEPQAQPELAVGDRELAGYGSPPVTVQEAANCRDNAVDRNTDRGDHDVGHIAAQCDFRTFWRLRPLRNGIHGISQPACRHLRHEAFVGQLLWHGDRQDRDGVPGQPLNHQRCYHDGRDQPRQSERQAGQRPPKLQGASPNTQWTQEVSQDATKRPRMALSGVRYAGGRVGLDRRGLGAGTIRHWHARACLSAAAGKYSAPCDRSMNIVTVAPFLINREDSAAMTVFRRHAIKPWTSPTRRPWPGIPSPPQ